MFLSPAAAGWPGIGRIMDWMLWVFSFQGPSRQEEEEAESDLDVVIDLLVKPGVYGCGPRLHL